MIRLSPRPSPSPDPSSQVLALVGLAFEARIAATPHVFVLCGQDGRDRFAAGRAHVDESCRALLSFGVAGGVRPDLRPGDLVIASSVIDAEAEHATDRDWTRRLLSAMPEAHFAPILGVDAPVADPRVKRELHERTGAVAVDMESHLVARLAATRELSFVSIRVVIDPAHRSVPAAAIAGMQPDGTTSVLSVLASLASRPSQALAMARIAYDMYVARNALLFVRERLGHGFGLIGHEHGVGARERSGGPFAPGEPREQLV